MATDIDPEERELEALYAAADFRGATVLEIGCGSGRLLRRYAREARLTVGVDPALEIPPLAAAPPNVVWLRASAEALPLAAGTCDRVLFGWSL